MAAFGTTTRAFDGLMYLIVVAAGGIFMVKELISPGDFGTVMGKFRHIKQVIGNPPHNLSDFRIIIVGIGKPLQMCISISPEAESTDRGTECEN